MKKIKVKILTPDKVILEDESEFVVLPGHSGELGVLPGHARLFALLKPGQIRVVMDKEETNLTISAGVAYIEPTVIKVICPVARISG
jgi:F-type H+-transporting ATPase subunit epsilon